MEHIIAVVVGHKRTGMTLGRYSGGPLLEQARRQCVEAVRLPWAPEGETPGSSMTSRNAGRETMEAKAACVRAVKLPK